MEATGPALGADVNAKDAGIDALPQIEFLYDPDCPSHREALARLQEVMVEHSITAEIMHEAVLSHEQATARQFLGSPTIRINGVDVDPSADGRHDYALACRAYVKADGRISPLPPRELIRDAFARAASGVSD